MHPLYLDLDIVNFPFLDGDVPRRPSCGVNISQLINFASVFIHGLTLMLVINVLKMVNFSNRVFGKISLDRLSFTARPIGTRILW